MGVSIANVNAGGTALFLAHVPPASFVTLATQDGNADIAWGFSSAVTYSTGSIIPPSGSFTFQNPPTAPPFDIWVISGTGTHEVSIQVNTAR